MKYKVLIGGRSWASGPMFGAETIREAREIAEGHEATADWAVVYDSLGRERARFVRDTSGDGSRWFRAAL